MRTIAVLIILLGAPVHVTIAGHAFSDDAHSGRRITYYVHAEAGNDANKGTSIESPFQSLARVNLLELNPGDRVLLASGQVFCGSLVLQNVRGDADHPVVISRYTTGKASKDPVIDACGLEAAVVLQNCSFVEVADLYLTATDKGKKSSNDRAVDKRCGLLVLMDEPGNYSHILLSSLHIEDVFYENPGFSRSLAETRSANGTQRYGWGIRVINKEQQAVLKDLRIESCHIENIGHTGIKLTSWRSGPGTFGIKDFRITDNIVRASGGPGIQMSGVTGGYISGNRVERSGSTDDSRKWGRGSGLWTWSSSHILIEKNYFLNANGPGDSAGAHIDFNCSHVILQYNLSANNAGGFCEILGNNHNCAYRYNISVNDGHRVKGENNAFQEGKILWLSGYQGKQKKRDGPFNSYFYNNTIIVNKDIVAKFAIDKAASGMLIANNIFCIEGETKWVLGDQYRPDQKGDAAMKNVVFRNNLYLGRYSWPADAPIQDQQPLVGDPGLAFTLNSALKDYMPKHKVLIQDAGIEIHPVPGDSIGLNIGLKVEKDILGQPVTGLPDLGAIEVNQDHF